MRARDTVVSIIAAVAACALLAGCSGGGSSDGGQPEGQADDSDSAYAAQLKPPLNRLGESANKMGQVLLSASDESDVVKVRRAADSRIGLVSQVQSQVTEIEVPDGEAQTQRLLRNAIALERQYLGRLVRVSSGDPERGLTQLPATRALGERMIEGYRNFYRVAPEGVPRVVTDAGLLDLSGLRSALQDAVPEPEPAPAPTPRPTPQPVPVPSGSAGIDYDIVDNSGGEGVRYRYSPVLSNLVPGNGPFEGDQLSISCFVDGEFVRSTSYWAFLSNGYYVPATYLRFSYSGPVIGARYC
ncbi:hypothetical protein [Miltoncostaea oceani]|uniref:hypothetical protein n=1 Tax=Miltoncostaea oceani TaxID=2843216 RepID=UPI001C3CCECB|nr:hypothetical protein [Miltoncostaea oceani]